MKLFCKKKYDQQTRIYLNRHSQQIAKLYAYLSLMRHMQRSYETNYFNLILSSSQRNNFISIYLPTTFLILKHSRLGSIRFV